MSNKFTFEEFLEELAANITTYELIEIKKVLLGHALILYIMVIN